MPNAPISPISSSRPLKNLLPLVLVFTGIASFANGAIGHGIFFVLKDQHKFSDRLNLLFALTMYLPYVPAALLAGRLSRRFGERAILLISVIVMAAAAALLAFNSAQAWCWVLAPIYTMCAGFQWPIVESYLTAGRHGPSMRRAIGIWNVTWAITICVGLWAVGFLLHYPSWLFGLIAVMHGFTVIVALMWPRVIPPHDVEVGAAHTGPQYRALLKSCTALLFMSYVLGYALTPLLPGVWTRLEIPLESAALWSSAWLVARILPFTIMYLSANWHGKWVILFVATILILTGFSLAVLGLSGISVVIGLSAFGLGHAMIYYSAIYYRMAVGHAKVESGGAHEALIGFGYVVGPAVALFGGAVVPGHERVGILVGVGMLVLTSLWFALRPFWSGD